MKKWITVTVSLAVLALATRIQAQQDHLIENQRYVVGINDFSWGNTYVGKYTSGNGLILREYIHTGGTNQVTLDVSSLQIGSPTNSGNYVDIYRGGTIEVANEIIINAPGNGNRLTIHDQGTLFAQSDFNAQMSGFSYTPGGRLKVGGEISNLDNVEGGLQFTLTGESASWNFASTNLTIGASSDANIVAVSNMANIAIENISIGGGTNNEFIVADNGRAYVQDSINILNAGNFVRVTNQGILEVDFDFDASVGVEVQYGGILEAHKDLIHHGVTNGGTIIMSGSDATWLNRSGTFLYVGGTNDNSLYVQNGATVRAGGLLIGDFNTESNNVYVRDGGNLIIESGVVDSAPTNKLWVTDGGILTLEGDASIGGWVWGNGGIVEALAEAPVYAPVRVDGKYDEEGILFLQNGQILILKGPTASWTHSTHNLHIGDLSPDNHLIITNGGKALLNSVSIGDFKEGNDGFEGGNRNSILITGTNSFLDSTSYVAIGGTMDLGNWYEGGISNSITVDNAGKLLVGTTLHNRNTTGTSGLHIKPGGIVDAQDYYQADGAYLMVYTDATGTNSGLLRVANTAEFEEGALVGFEAVAALDIDKIYTNQIVEAGTLLVDGITNATTADLAALENIGGSLVNYNLWETNQNIYATYTRRSLAANDDPDSLLSQIKTEIERLASTGNAAASNQVQILSGMSDAERDRQLEQLYLYELPTYMHNQGIFGGINQVRARGTSTRGQESSPKGASGPHAADQGLQGWAKVYGSYGNRDADGDTNLDDGYDQNAFGTVIGVDQSFGDWLFGIAGGYSLSTLDGDNGDESDADTIYGLLYASFGTEDWFGDLIVSYGSSDIDNESGTAFDVSSSVDASQTALYLGVGKEFQDPDGSGALLRPLFGLQLSQYDQDAYEEKSSNAVAKDVDAYDRWSYQSIFGATMILPSKGKKTDIETQLRAFWLHEFNDDEEKIDYTLIGSDQAGQFILRSPESDVGQFGIGLVAKWDNGLQLRGDLDAQVSSDFYSTTLSGALLYEF
jgi:hypothetical protein